MTYLLIHLGLGIGIGLLFRFVLAKQKIPLFAWAGIIFFAPAFLVLIIGNLIEMALGELEL